MCTVAPYRDASLSCLGSDERSQRLGVQGLQEPPNREGKTKKTKENNKRYREGKTRGIKAKIDLLLLCRSTLKALAMMSG